MRATFHLPSGATVRTQTVRDYVLILEDSTGAWIERRSDSSITIEGSAGRLRKSGHPARRYFGNTTTREVTVLP